MAGFKMVDARCETCRYERIDFLLRSDGVIAPCAVCGGEMHRILRESGHQTAHVIGDDIPGGIYIKHGICNNDGTPKRYDTKSSMREAAAAKGLVNRVEHETDPKSGSDKSKFTQRFIGLPSALNPAQEAERVRAWHEHERNLKLDEEKEPNPHSLDSCFDGKSWAQQQLLKELDR